MQRLCKETWVPARPVSHSSPLQVAAAGHRGSPTEVLAEQTHRVPGILPRPSATRSRRAPAHRGRQPPPRAEKSPRPWPRLVPSSSWARTRSLQESVRFADLALVVADEQQTSSAPSREERARIDAASTSWSATAHAHPAHDRHDRFRGPRRPHGACLLAPRGHLLRGRGQRRCGSAPGRVAEEIAQAARLRRTPAHRCLR